MKTPAGQTDSMSNSLRLFSTNVVQKRVQRRVRCQVPDCCEGLLKPAGPVGRAPPGLIRSRDGGTEGRWGEELL